MTQNKDIENEVETSHYVRTLTPGSRFVPNKTIDPKSIFEIANTGDTVLLVFRGANKLSPPPKQPSQLLLGDILDATMNELPGMGPMLIVLNSSSTQTGKVEVSMG